MHTAFPRLVAPTLISLLLPAMNTAQAEPPGVNYDESKIAPYTLPDPLVCADGTKVTDTKTWREKRRPELLELFRANMDGRSPARPADMKFETTSAEPRAVDGKA